MSCAGCEAHAVRIAELESELAAWRGAAADETRAADDAQRWHRWKRRLDVLPAAAKVLIALVDASPRPVSFERMCSAARPGRELEDLQHLENLSRQYVSKLRAALRRAGLSLTIHPVREAGYVIDPDQAAAFRRTMGEA